MRLSPFCIGMSVVFVQVLFRQSYLPNYYGCDFVFLKDKISQQTSWPSDFLQPFHNLFKDVP